MNADATKLHVLDLEFADRIVLSDGGSELQPEDELRAAQTGDALALFPLPSESRLVSGVLHLCFGQVDELFAERHGAHLTEASLRLPTGKLRVGLGEDDDECRVLKSIELDAGDYLVDGWFVRWQEGERDERPAAIVARLDESHVWRFRLDRWMPGYLIALWVLTAALAALNWGASGMTIVLIPAAPVGVAVGLWLAWRTGGGAAMRAEVARIRLALPDFILRLRPGAPERPRAGVLRALHQERYASSVELGRWQQLAGLPIYDFDPNGGGLRDPAIAVPRLNVRKRASRDVITTYVEQFLGTMRGEPLRALSIGAFPDDPVRFEAMCSALPDLSSLRHLIVGDVAGWSDLQHGLEERTGLVAMCPGLEELVLRGCAKLDWAALELSGLRRLVLESMRFPEVLGELARKSWLRLESLELWCGYEGLEPAELISTLGELVETGRVPKLRHLGLRVVDELDDLVIAMVDWPVLAQLESLDVSFGDLGYLGAMRILESSSFDGLKCLDLRCNWIPAPEEQALREKFADRVKFGRTFDDEERAITPESLVED